MRVPAVTVSPARQHRPLGRGAAAPRERIKLVFGLIFLVRLPFRDCSRGCGEYECIYNFLIYKVLKWEFASL